MWKLRREVSGESWQRDVARIHGLAEQRGWLVMLMYFGDDQGPVTVINQLMNLAYGRYVEEVVAPSLDHFADGEVAALVKIADVVCVDTGQSTVGYPGAQRRDCAILVHRSGLSEG